MNCKWLPDLYNEPDWNNYEQYENILYNFFINTYLNKNCLFQGKPVKYRKYPMQNDRFELFYHIICKNYANIENRQPDSDRITRIEWASAFIQNYKCTDNCCTEKPHYWVKEKRHKILFCNYLVILEERTDYFLLITGFCVDAGYLIDLQKEYQKCRV